MTNVRDIRARAAHLYRHPEEATHDDIRALVVMSEALRECRVGDVRDRYVLLSVWGKDAKNKHVMVSDPLATDEEIMDIMAGMVRRMGLKPKEEG